ncbi:MAG: hypothetical protein WAO20_06925 [Acidobacteriota bacterium]
MNRELRHYRELSEWQVSTSHSTYVSQDAEITGTVMLDRMDLLSQGYFVFAGIETGRSGATCISRQPL